MSKRANIAIGVVIGLIVPVTILCTSVVFGSYSVKYRAHLIKHGQNSSEIEEVIGKPPGDYSRPNVVYTPVRVLDRSRGRTLCWSDNSGKLFVCLNAEGKVADWVVADAVDVSDSFINRIRAFLEHSLTVREVVRRGRQKTAMSKLGNS
jgi:hypothetical protein